jgi:hypothetical protein
MTCVTLSCMTEVKVELWTLAEQAPYELGRPRPQWPWMVYHVPTQDLWWFATEAGAKAFAEGLLQANTYRPEPE